MHNALAVTKLQAADIQTCSTVLRRGSRSFYLASRFLPAAVRGPVTALYAFCRQADDAIDTAAHPTDALVALRQRLDRIYNGVGLDTPIDRAMAATVQAQHLPRALFDALLEGFAWDAEGRQYASLSEVLAYSARVAGSVGVLMTLLMGRREPWVLGRAAELGVAMQLTNIARDIGEDARLGRLYLPSHWFAQAGLTPSAWLQRPTALPAVRAMVQRLIVCAVPLYNRADAALMALPLDCRISMHAALRIYRDLHRSIKRQHFDTVTSRAYVTFWRKMWLAMGATALQFKRIVRPPWRPQFTATLPEVQFLVAAVHPQHGVEGIRAHCAASTSC